MHRILFVLILIGYAKLLTGQPYHKILEIVLERNTIGKEYTFYKTDKEYGKLEYFVKYIGTLTTKKGNYKIVTQTLISGISHHATNFIYVFNNQNKRVGYYHVVLVDELPIKINKGYLFFYSTEKKVLEKVFCGDGLPVQLYGRTMTR